jgi:hypothetical protein
MQQITGFIKTVYNFFVGDPVILTGVAITFIVLAVLVRVLTGSTTALGVVLVAGVVGSLALSLYRETQPKR